MIDITPDELRRFFPKASASTLHRNSAEPNGAKPDGVAHTSQQKSNPGHEPVGKIPRAPADPKRRFVRLQSYRFEPVDTINIWHHYVIDALVEAGILTGDTEAWLGLEVIQIKVDRRELERTEITIAPWP